MGLGQALTTAVGGLRVTQSALSLVASNIANAETPGYVKKTATQVAAASGDVTIGVRLSSINRELDQFLQRQLRAETSGGAYATLRSDFFQRLQGIFGQPGSEQRARVRVQRFRLRDADARHLAGFERLALFGADRRPDAGAASQRA